MSHGLLKLLSYFLWENRLVHFYFFSLGKGRMWMQRVTWYAVYKHSFFWHCSQAAQARGTGQLSKHVMKCVIKWWSQRMQRLHCVELWKGEDLQWYSLLQSFEQPWTMWCDGIFLTYRMEVTTGTTLKYSLLLPSH